MCKEFMLFQSYVKEEKMEEAFLVGRNMVARKPGSRKGVEAYLTYLLQFSKQEENLSERMRYLAEAKTVLTGYERNARLNPAVVETIMKLRKEMADIDESQKSEFLLKLEQKNNASLDKLEQLEKQLEEVTRKEDMKPVLSGIQDVLGEIEKNCLTEEQRSRYKTLNEALESQVAKKVECFG